MVLPLLVTAAVALAGAGAVLILVGLVLLAAGRRKWALPSAVAVTIGLALVLPAVLLTSFLFLDGWRPGGVWLPQQLVFTLIAGRVIQGRQGL